jgi:hypothetical protein
MASLPAGLDDSWEQSLVGVFAEADAADAEIADVALGSSAEATPRVSSDSELGLLLLLVL